MSFIKNKKALLRGSISSKPQLPSRKWLGVPDPWEGKGGGGEVAQMSPNPVDLH